MKIVNSLNCLVSLIKKHTVILNTQELDGTWGITWSWKDYHEHWKISKKWQKSDLIIKMRDILKQYIDKFQVIEQTGKQDLQEHGEE